MRRGALRWPPLFYRLLVPPPPSPRVAEQAAPGKARGNIPMENSSAAAMDKDALKKQIENMKYQATMERWPLSRSIAA